jgi:hypothetical protein
MRDVDTVEFRIERRELGDGVQDCVEIAVNGRDLCDLLREVEQPLPTAGSYAGLQPQFVLAPHSRFLDDRTAPAKPDDPAHDYEDDEARRRTFVLRCNCGDHRCSYALAKIRVDNDRVTWSDFWGSHGAPATAYQSLGPFEFDRVKYERALLNARKAG